MAPGPPSNAAGSEEEGRMCSGNTPPKDSSSRPIDKLQAEQTTIPATQESTSNLVDEVAQGVKSAIQDAVAWTEKQVNKLGEAEDSTGPYASPATCVPNDLDPIASGVLPAIPTSKKLKDYDDQVSKEDQSHPNTERSGKDGKAKD